MKHRSAHSVATASKLALIALAAIILTPLVSLGQAVSARLVGSVEDFNKSRIVSAKVEARNVETGQNSVETTNSSGEFTFANIAPGRYVVTAKAEGFGTVEIKDVVLQIGDSKSLNFALALKTVTQDVQVIESVPTIDTGSTQVGAVVEARQAVDLPLNGRDAMTLVFLQAGTNPLDNQVPSGSQQQTGVVDGLPPGTSEVRVEGILAINSSYDYAPSHPSFPVPEEAVGEYRVNTSGNGSGDGPSSGAEVKALVKSGTNSLHGSLYEFNRNTALEANYFFNKFNKSAANVVEQPALHKNQYGFALGGPIRKNKTFFFGTAEWQRQVQNDPEEATVYTNSLRQGLFQYYTLGKNSTSLVNPQTGAPIVAPGTIDTVNLTTIPGWKGFDTVYLPGLLKSLPAPNAWDIGDGLNTAGFRYQSPDTDNYYQALLKFDHQLTTRNSLALTLSQYSENAPTARYYTGTIEEGYTEVRRGLSLRLATSFSPKLSNELSVGGAIRLATRANTTTYCETPTTNITLSGLGTLCDNRSTQRNPAVNEGFQDVVTKIVGKHTFEFGAEYWYETLNRLSGSRYPLINTSNSYNPVALPTEPSLNSTDLANAEQWVKDLSGSIGSIAQTFYLTKSDQYSAFSPLQEELRKNESGFFAHDSWRVLPHLTFNLGLRWDILPPVKNNDGYVYPVGGYNGALGAQGPTGAPTSWATAPNGGGSIYATDLKAFSPSVGVAWDPFGDGKSVIRSSYHISSVRSMMISADLSELENGSSTSLTITPAATFSQFGSVVPIPVPTPFAAVPSTRQGYVVVANPGLSVPYVQEWTFGLDRQVFRDWRVSGTYVGNHAVGMWRSSDLNQVQINSNGFLSAFLIAQQNLAANGTPTKGTSLGALQSLFAEVPKGEYTVITQGQVASLANYLDTTTSGGAVGGLVTAAGLPATFFRYNPQFKDVYTVGNYGQSNWNALKLEAQHKLSRGAYIQANYTFSKGFVNFPQDEEYFDANPFRDIANPGLDKALSPLDATHVVLINGLYELPFGHGKALFGGQRGLVNALIGDWQASGIFNFTTGRPLALTTGYFQLNQNVASTPNFSGSFSNLETVNKSSTAVTFITPAQAAAFSNPAPGSAGGLSAGELHGPGYTNLDASLFKSFSLGKLHEGTRLQFRAEFFNTLNHANFKSPNVNINSASFGNLTSTYSPRVGQLAAKITF
jgi:Carboxypeptidase regulatory-like domain